MKIRIKPRAGTGFSQELADQPAVCLETKTGHVYYIEESGGGLVIRGEDSLVIWPETAGEIMVCTAETSLGPGG